MISIIIPVYNVEKYIEQCLSSIVNQTFKNIEIIIVDDGSTDNSYSIIRKFEEKYKNILYLSQQNKGVSSARNLGLRYAKGQYILFVDPDDYLDLTMLEKLRNKIMENNSDMAICGYTAIYDDTIKGETSDVVINCRSDIKYDGIEVGNMMLAGSVRGFMWDKLFKKEQLVKYEFTLEEGRYIQDWYPIFKQVINSKSIVFVNEPLYKYRQRATSTVNKKNIKLLEDYIYATSNILDYIEHNGINIKMININKFKVQRFFGCINYYSKIRTEESNIYKSFNKSIYNTYKVSIIEVIKCKNLNSIIKYISWKLRFYHLIVK